MNMITQEAKKRQAVVKCAAKRGKSYAAAKYGVSLSSVKRWSKRYDGTWQSLSERSHRPKSHPKQHRARGRRNNLVKRSRLNFFVMVGTAYLKRHSKKVIREVLAE